MEKSTCSGCSDLNPPLIESYLFTKRRVSKARKSTGRSPRLPIFGKIFKNLLFDDKYEHLSASCHLSHNQSGLRPGDSTINQLLAINHKTYSGFDQVPSREPSVQFRDLNTHKFHHNLALYVNMVRLMRTTSIISYTAPALINCGAVSLTLSQKFWVRISQTCVQQLTLLPLSCHQSIIISLKNQGQ